MLKRIIFTVIVILVIQTGLGIYEAGRGPIESKIAVGQLNDSVVDYTLAREIATRDLVNRVSYMLLFIILLAIWYKPIAKIISKTAKEIKESQEKSNEG